MYSVRSKILEMSRTSVISEKVSQPNSSADAARRISAWAAAAASRTLSQQGHVLRAGLAEFEIADQCAIRSSAERPITLLHIFLKRLDWLEL